MQFVGGPALQDSLPAPPRNTSGKSSTKRKSKDLSKEPRKECDEEVVIAVDVGAVVPQHDISAAMSVMSTGNQLRELMVFRA